MAVAPEVVADVTKRLRRAEGQVRGVARMLDEGEDATAVLTQLAAATKALQQAGFRLVASDLTDCVSCPDPDDEHVAKLEQLFLRL